MTTKTKGRPVIHNEPWSKITVVMLDRHVAYLDRLAIDIRLKTGKAISRAELIRGFLEGIFDTFMVDVFTEATSVEDVAARLKKAVR